jgi:hypothetical protein
MKAKKAIWKCCRCKLSIPSYGWCERCFEEEFPELKEGGLASLTSEERTLAMFRAVFPRTNEFDERRQG